MLQTVGEAEGELVAAAVLLCECVEDSEALSVGEAVGERVAEAQGESLKVPAPPPTRAPASLPPVALGLTVPNTL